MDIKRSGSQPSGKGPAEYFTGTVRIDPLFQAPDPVDVEVIPIQKVNEAYERLLKADVKYRFSIDMASL